MTLSVTMFLGLMLALMVSGKPKTYLIETVDNADILVTYINNQREFMPLILSVRLWVSQCVYFLSGCLCVCVCLLWFLIKFPYNTITVCMSVYASFSLIVS